MGIWRGYHDIAKAGGWAALVFAGMFILLDTFYPRPGLTDFHNRHGSLSLLQVPSLLH